MSENASTTLPAVVEKVIRPLQPGEPEKAQISVERADHLYRELRIENVLTNENGERVKLKPGAEVDVTIEALPDATISHKESAADNDRKGKKDKK
jgi:hypothetical protein